MNKLLPKLNTAALLVIAVSLSVIAYQGLQPAFVETDKGIYLDTRSGKFFQKQGEQLVPMDQSTKDKLRKEFPDGRTY